MKVGQFWKIFCDTQVSQFAIFKPTGVLPVSSMGICRTQPSPAGQNQLDQKSSEISSFIFLVLIILIKDIPYPMTVALKL